jgi:predicted metal-binding membrane protein
MSDCMSMMWMRMPGQTWPGVAAAFLGMWMVMMVVMMLPTLTPILWRYRGAVAQAGLLRSACLMTLVTAGYFFVWTVLGLIVFVVGAGLTALEMQATPVLAGLVVLVSGALQLTRWKARRLACCREFAECGCRSVATPASAWRHGLKIGLQCNYCCAGFTAILLAVGVMDLRAMAVITAAISLERLLPGGKRVAQAIGVAVVAAGFVMIIHQGSTGVL